MDFDQLRMLLDYHYWARDRMIAAVAALSPEQFNRDLGSSFPSVRETLAHLYGAEWVWRERWEGHTPGGLPAASHFPDLATLRAAWLDEEVRVRGLVTRLGPAGVLAEIAYVRHGVRYSQPFWQLLQHVVNHGTYHRGQLTTMLRQLGASAPVTDLIVFYRERGASAA
jgi:uncharacterized damage-inducible protein DinB